MTDLPAASETGSLRVMHLKRAWARFKTLEQAPNDPQEGHRDRLVFHALGLGLEQTIQFLGQTNPSFEAFEAWIADIAGGVPPDRIARINAAMAGKPPPPETRLAAIDAILAHRNARLDDPESWYQGSQSIMVQAFQHPAFDANRRAIRVHKAYAQLWGTADLWVTTDRAGFNVPERSGWQFQGPDLHWDVSLARPMGFHTQGVLYLTDTQAEQGAFTCVPGFHKRIDAWLESLPPGTDPRTQDLHAMGSRPIPGRAGDLIIWHDALPHGSRPNRATVPRIVQYIAMYPFAPTLADRWV